MEQTTSKRRGRRSAKEVISTDAPMEQMSAIQVPNDGPIVRENEEIALCDKPLEKEYADALAFNEDVLTIMLQPSGEENAPTVIDVYINGEPRWIKVGEPTQVKRKFVEALLRAKPIAVTTQHDDIGAKVINNQILRHQRAKYPLSILQDPSPKGGEWLNRMMYER